MTTRKNVMSIAIILLEFQKLNSFMLKIDLSAMCSSFFCHKFKIYDEKQLLQLRNIDLRIRYAENLHYYHSKKSFF